MYVKSKGDPRNAKGRKEVGEKMRKLGEERRGEEGWDGGRREGGSDMEDLNGVFIIIDIIVLVKLHVVILPIIWHPRHNFFPYKFLGY